MGGTLRGTSSTYKQRDCCPTLGTSNVKLQNTHTSAYTRKPQPAMAYLRSLHGNPSPHPLGVDNATEYETVIESGLAEHTSR